MRARRTRSLLTGVVVALLSGACSGESSAPASDGTGAGATSQRRGDASEPQEVKIVAVDYAYTEVPLELEGGVIDLTFENRGTVGHEVALAGIGDTPLDRWVKDLGGGNGLEGNPLPDYLDQVAVPPFVNAPAGETAEDMFTLTPGRYALFCAVRDASNGGEEAAHYQWGMITAVTVSGGDLAPQLPEADGTIVASDYDFDVDLEAGDRNVNFINAGPDQIHMATVEMYPEGVDAAEGRRAFEARLEPGPTPKGLPRLHWLGYAGIFSEGLGSTFELDEGVFESGRTYVFQCWVPDREGGKGHLEAYGMYEIVTIE